MQTARTSETSVDIQLRTRQYIPEDSELHTRRRENLKSYKCKRTWTDIILLQESQRICSFVTQTLEANRKVATDVKNKNGGVCELDSTN
jgi:hypothetical protein